MLALNVVLNIMTSLNINGFTYVFALKITFKYCVHFGMPLKSETVQ